MERGEFLQYVNTVGVQNIVYKQTRLYIFIKQDNQKAYTQKNKKPLAHEEDPRTYCPAGNGPMSSILFKKFVSLYQGSKRWKMGDSGNMKLSIRAKFL